MDKIIDQIVSLKSMLQILEDDVEKMQKLNENHETKYQKLKKEIIKLNLENLFQGQNIDLKVLCSNTQKYPILDDFLEEFSKFTNYKSDLKLLGYSCFNYIRELTSIRTIEILLKTGLDLNSKSRSKYDLLSDVFDVENEEYDEPECFKEKYKIIGDLLFANGYKPDYSIFYIDGCLVDGREINYVDYCIQKIPRDDIKKMIEDIIEDKHNFYSRDYEKKLLDRFFKSYPNTIMEMIQN